MKDISSSFSAIDTTGVHFASLKAKQIGNIVSLTMQVDLTIANNASVEVPNFTSKIPNVGNFSLNASIGTTNRPYIDTRIGANGVLVFLNRSDSAISNQAYIISGTYLVD